MELEILKEIKTKIKNLEDNQNKIKNALNKLNSNLNIIFKDVRWLCRNVAIQLVGRDYPP